jgi:hypothetical protein
VDAFAAVPDPRARQGRRFTLAALLTLTLAAMLANHRSPFAIAEWGAEQDDATRRALGFTKGVTPHRSTFQRLFRRLNPALLSAALTAQEAMADPAAPGVRGAAGIAIDGKTQRGRLAFVVPAGAPVHALSAYTHTEGAVLAHQVISGAADKGRRN